MAKICPYPVILQSELTPLKRLAGDQLGCTYQQSPSDGIYMCEWVPSCVGACSGCTTCIAAALKFSSDNAVLAANQDQTAFIAVSSCPITSLFYDNLTSNFIIMPAWHYVMVSVIEPSGDT